MEETKTPSYMETYRSMMLALQYLQEIAAVAGAMRCDNWNGLRDLIVDKCDEAAKEIG